MILLGYVALCLVISLIAWQRGFSFIVTFLLGFILTPIVSFIVVFALNPKPNQHAHIAEASYCSHCGNAL